MDRASLTAELATLARASQTKEPEAIRGPDDLAIRFLGPAWRIIVNNEPIRRLFRAVMTRRMPGAYGFLIPRSKSFDRFVRQELEAGATQLVVLGAGYDSRAYRFRDLILKNGGRAFEVDAPPTSKRKRHKVKRAFGALPTHVRYVEVDFDRESLKDQLIAAGYDPTARTVFTWEGVTFYITASAVDAVLSFVAEQSAPGSGLAFDYLFRSVLDPHPTAFGAKESVEYVRRRGEPFTFGIDEDRIGTFLVERGFNLEDHLRPEEMEAQFLGEYARERVLRVSGFYGIAMARTRSH